MTHRISALATAIALALTLIGLAAVNSADTSSGGAGATPGNVAPGQNPCLTQKIKDLEECAEKFCPNLFSCNHALLASCIRGADAAFEECIHPGGGS